MAKQIIMPQLGMYMFEAHDRPLDRRRGAAVQRAMSWSRSRRTRSSTPSRRRRDGHAAAGRPGRRLRPGARGFSPTCWPRGSAAWRAAPLSAGAGQTRQRATAERQSCATQRRGTRQPDRSPAGHGARPRPGRPSWARGPDGRIGEADVLAAVDGPADRPLHPTARVPPRSSVEIEPPAALTPPLPPAADRIPVSGIRQVIFDRMAGQRADRRPRDRVHGGRRHGAGRSPRPPQGRVEKTDNLSVSYNDLLIAIVGPRPARASTAELDLRRRRDPAAAGDPHRPGRGYRARPARAGGPRCRRPGRGATSSARCAGWSSAPRRAEACPRTSPAAPSPSPTSARSRWTASRPSSTCPNAPSWASGASPPGLRSTSGAIAIRQMMILSLSFDHRLVDGAPAARFLQRVKHIAEDPCLLLAAGH